MKHNCCKCCLLLVSMLFLLLPGLANAQVIPPGVCSDTWSTCTATNTCPSSSTQCNVQLSHNAGNAITVYNGATVTSMCVYPGQILNWQEAEQNAEFAVTFLSTPFISNQYLFQGSSGTPASGTVANALGYACYKFSIRQQVGPTIYPADPKVIVHGVGDVGGQHKKRRKKQGGDDQSQPPQQ
jgi:hypothetical protein